MKKKILLLMMSICAFSFAQAQVGINTTTPHQSAALEVQSTDKGVLISRMTTVQKNAITQPAHGLLVYDTDLNCISQNLGTEANPNWMCLSGPNPLNRIFYMPSIAIDASTVGNGRTINLYNHYSSQFTSPEAKNTLAPASIAVYPANALNYYVTAADASVIQITSISATGVMTYNILQVAFLRTFINVVFVVK